MFYLKLIFINIFRSLRYTIPLFLIFALTTSIVVLTDNARKAGNILKEQIANSYVTTVEAIYSYPVLLSGKISGSSQQELEWNDIKTPSSFSQVQMTSYISYYNLNNPMLWELNFDKTLLDKGDINIENQAMLGILRINGIQNSQFIDSMELIRGSHLTDNDNGQYRVLISSVIAELHNLDVGDTISFPLEKSNDLLAQKYEIVGIIKGNEYLIYIPSATIMEKYTALYDYTFNNVKFILKSPELAAEFIEEAIPYFDEKEYMLQSDDYEYKRELYPVEMMINLNSALYIVCMITGALLLSVIMIKAAYIRVKDITVMRFLACKKIYIFLIYYLEKFLVMLAGIAAGFTTSVFLSDIYNNFNAIYEKIQFGIEINVVYFILLIILICTLLLSLIFIFATSKKTMEAITHD